MANDLASTNGMLPPEVQPQAPALLPADPADIAQLFGLATYAGTATGTVIDLTGVSAPQSFTGTSVLAFNFDDRVGALQLDIPAGLFTVPVEALPNNIAQFSGSAPIFGGPDTFDATGGFLSSPDDDAASVAGTFDLNLVSQDQDIMGIYDASR